MRTRQRIGKAVVADVGPDAPVGSLPDTGLERVDRLPLAQRAHLVVHQIQHAIGMARPIGLGLLLRPELPSRIADEHRLVLLPGGFEPHVVVHTAIGQDDTTGERLALEIETGARREAGRIEPQLERGEHRRKRRRGGHGMRQRDGRRLELADAIVAHVGLHEAPERAGLHVGGVDDEAWTVGKVLKRRALEEMLVVGRRHPLADASGKQAAEHDGIGVDGLAGERSNGATTCGTKSALRLVASKLSVFHLSASSPEVIDPPDTLEKRPTRPSRLAS